jgi:hypothetical protein
MDRVVLWAPALLIAAVPLLAIRQVVRPPVDPDLFWHLRMGVELTRTWEFSGPEVWSRFADRPLVYHEWPLQVVFAQVVEHFGKAGLVTLQAILPVALLLSLYVIARREAAPIVAALVAFAGWLGTSGSFALRPQLASFILLAVATSAWLSTARDGRPRWWLVPLTWAWACIHGLWSIGAIVALVVLAGMILDAPRQWGRVVRPSAVLLASLVAAGLTPNGPALLLTPGGMTGYARFVTEWNPPPLLTPYSIATVGLAMVTVAVWCRGRVRPTWAQLAVWALGLGFAMLYSRTVAVGAVLLVPLAAAALAAVAPAATLRIRAGAEATVLLVGVLLFAVLVGLTASGVAERTSPYPERFSSGLAALPAGTGVLNDYGLGGWLLWTHPGLDPYVDGRADVYTVEHLDAYADLLRLAPGWQDRIQLDGLRVAILPEVAPLSTALVSQLGWTVASTDRGYVMLTAPS